MPDLTPDDVAGREFRSSFRGYEPTEVRSFLSEVSAGLRVLLDEIERLRAQVASGTPADVKSEIDAVSAEVHSVLRSAQEAAESMRERAANDATRWRSEAVAEAENARNEAAVDAEALRSDAWTMSEQLLTQCQVEAERVVEDAKKEALRIVGEAERESHRLQAGARRESEDLVRSARMEAEQLQAQAKARHDELISDAQKQSESAQERTLALEKRRQELLGELESVRYTLNQVEDALDQRRERLGLSPASESVGKIVTKDRHAAAPEEEETDENWVPGETVRVVRPSRPGEEAGSTEITSHPPQPEVKVLSGSEFARIKAGIPPDEAPTDEPAEGANEVPVVEDESLLDQREESHSTTVRLVERNGHDAPPVRPEPEMLEPEDFSGPVETIPGDEEADADGEKSVAPPSMDESEGEELETSRPEDEPAVAAPPVAVSGLPHDDDTSEGEGAVVADDDVADDQLVEGVFAADETEAEPVEDGLPEPPPIAQSPESASEPAPEPTRYNFGDHVVVRSSPVASSEAAAAQNELESASTDEPGSEDDQQTLFGEVAGLFDRLRVDEPRTSAETPATDPAVDEVEAMMSRRLVSSLVDAFELRDRLLLPVGNRALRNLKRQLTEAQNVALEEIRLDETGWVPDADSVRERVSADLKVLFAESFGSGHSAAEEVLGGRVPRPATPQTDVTERFVADLTAELAQVVDEGRAAGQGARQLGATLSRVFRGWRTDQAERRVRDLSLTGYHLGLVRSFELGDGPALTWKVAGRGCATCRAAGEETPSDQLPPIHPGCECTLGP